MDKDTEQPKPEKSKTWTYFPTAKILLWSKGLKYRSRIVEDFGPDLERLVDYLTGTMYEHNGVGLAAPQIGCFVRVAVVQLIEDRTRPPLILVNPTIVNSAGNCVEWEGCLSVPGDRTRARIARAHFLKVLFQDITGASQELECAGMMARAVAHEVDHLDGKFYFDHISALKRDVIVGHYRGAVKKKDPEDLLRSFMYTCPFENSVAIPAVAREDKNKEFKPVSAFDALQQKHQEGREQHAINAG